MIVKAIVILTFFSIVISLGIALHSLVKNKGDKPSERALKALTVRISVSVLVFVFVYIALAAGLFEPKGIGAKIQQHRQSQPQGQ